MRNTPTLHGRNGINPTRLFIRPYQKLELGFVTFAEFVISTSGARRNLRHFRFLALLAMTLCCYAPEYFFNTSAAFCPPKPNEFDITMLVSIARDAIGT